MTTQQQNVAPPTDEVSQVRNPAHWVELMKHAFTPGTYEAVSTLSRFIHPDFRGTAPQSPIAIGPAGWLRFFEQLYVLVPNLTGEILRTGATQAGDGLYVEIRLRGTLKGRDLSVDVCDHFTFQDGLVFSRVTYFDPLPLVAALLTRPTAWPAWLRMRFGSKPRTCHTPLPSSAPVTRMRPGCCAPGGVCSALALMRNAPRRLLEAGI